MSCTFCGKECNGKRGLVTHERTCKLNPARSESNLSAFKKSNPSAWNKGLTKEDHPSIAQYGATQSKALTGRVGRKHTEAAKLKISKTQSTNNRGGRCKWYSVNGVKVQGTWEKALAEKLTEMNIAWTKIGTNSPQALRYVMDGKTRHYSPDFYLPEHDVYLEVKGFWWGDDFRKMEIVKATHPALRIVVLEREQYERILQGELVW